MEFVIALLILSSLFLTAVTMLGLRLMRALTVQAIQAAATEKLRNETIKHLSNLLASKDPLAFQAVQAVSTLPETGYTGPILSGDEIELGLLEENADAIDAAFGRFITDSE
jgi:hypothetical protein